MRNKRQQRTIIDRLELLAKVNFSETERIKDTDSAEYHRALGKYHAFMRALEIVEGTK